MSGFIEISPRSAGFVSVLYLKCHKIGLHVTSWAVTSYQSTRVIASIHNLDEDTRWLDCQFRAADTYCDIRMPSIMQRFYWTCPGPYQTSTLRAQEVFMMNLKRRITRIHQSTNYILNMDAIRKNLEDMFIEESVRRNHIYSTRWGLDIVTAI